MSRLSKIVAACGVALVLLASAVVTTTALSSDLAAAQGGATYWVDTASGSDSNSGTSAGDAFKTIQAAADRVSAGATVNVRAGVYRETVTVPQSGAAGAPITFQAYQDEAVAISAADLVTGWSSLGSNQWVATVDYDAGGNPENNTVFADGAVTLEASFFGENDLLNVDDWGEFRKGQLTNTTLKSDELIGTGNHRWNGATVRYLINDWTPRTSVIADFDSSTGTITFAEPIPNPSQKASYPFRIVNTIEALDKPGEWYKDSANDLLYFQTPNGRTPDDMGVEFKRRGRAFDLKGREHIHLLGFEFRGATIDTDNDSAFHVVQGNRFHAYGKGATSGFDRFQARGSNHVYRDNEFHTTFGMAVEFSGSGHRVINNYFHDISVTGMRQAIGLSSADEMLFSHNTIRKLARSVIDGYPLRSVVSHNLIEDIGNLSWDSGAFDSDGENGNSSFSRFHHNVIRDTNTRGIFNAFYGQNENAVIDHNLIYGFVGGNWMTPFAAEGDDFRQVFHNTVISDRPPRGDTNATNAVGTRYNNNLQISTIYMASLGVDMRGNHDYTPSDFVDFNNGDFRLAAGSGAIDAGIVIPGINDDYRGNAPDAGALEKGAPMWEFGHDFDNPPNPQYLTPTIAGSNIVINPLFSEGLSGWTTRSGEPNARDRNSWNLGSNSLTGGFRTGSAELLPGAAISQTISGLQPDTTYTLGAAARVVTQISSGGDFDASASPVRTGTARNETYVTGIASGDWVRYDNVDFGEQGQYDTFELLPNVEVIGSSVDGVRLQARLDAPDGPLIFDTTAIPVNPTSQVWQLRVRGFFESVGGSHALFVSATGTNAPNLAIGPMRLLTRRPIETDKLTVRVEAGRTPATAQIGFADWQPQLETLSFTTGPTATSAELIFENNGRSNNYLDRLFLAQGFIDLADPNIATTDGVANSSPGVDDLNSSDSWSQIEFATAINIGEIELFNHVGIRSRELSNFTVSVWDDLPAAGGQIVWERAFQTNTALPPGTSLRIPADAVSTGTDTRLASTLGRAVRVQLNGRNLAGTGRLGLADIKVLAGQDAPMLRNLARYGTASASTAFRADDFRGAQEAIDGLINPQDIYASRLALVPSSQSPWWQVDLHQQPQIDQIVAYWRGDDEGQLDHDYSVSVWTDDPDNGGTELWHKTYPSALSPGNKSVINGTEIGRSGNRLESVTEGRIVRLTLQGYGEIGLWETQVWGSPRPANPDIRYISTYNYDLGSDYSPVATLDGDWKPLTPTSSGLIKWSAPVASSDIGPGAGVNQVNQDTIYSTEPRTLSVAVLNGEWDITVNMGDTTVSRDYMSVTAEGTPLATRVDAAPSQFPSVTGRVSVSDGWLDITFDDNGGTDPTWSVSRLSLSQNGQPAISPGDVNCDGIVNILDAYAVAQYAVQSRIGQQDCSDLNRLTHINTTAAALDGEPITIQHAYWVAQCAVGLTNRICPPR